MAHVDAHHHLWRINRGDYGWLTPELAPIYRDFLCDDLRPLLQAANVKHTVLVQAAPSTAETAFLLASAEREDVVAGVVGWIDYDAIDAPDAVRKAAAARKLKGLRPMMQDIADDAWMINPRLAPAFEAMIQTGLRFDALVKPRHLKNLALFLKRYPDLRVVVDHCAKPNIGRGEFKEWAQNLSEVADCERVCCKLSGLVTEAGPLWEEGDLRPYIDHVIAVFGPSRVMWGSDWPVLNLASGYAEWFAVTQRLLAELSESEQTAIMGDTARSFYGLES